MTRLLIILPLLLLLLGSSVAEAIKNCPVCGYRVSTNAVECPKCLKLLNWPYEPPRERKATVIVRTGKDAFIRDQHSQNRRFRFDRNAGADLCGPIGSWGGPTTLRYLLRFDVTEAFSQAGVDLREFKFHRALLKICIADEGDRKGPLPIRLYALSRHFQEGSDNIGERKKFINGCSWKYCAPLMVWHREGGDFINEIGGKGLLPTAGEAIIDVSEVFRHRFAEFHENGVWEDPGMIIMRDPHAPGDYGYLNIYSFESRAVRGKVRAPELFLE